MDGERETPVILAVDDAPANIDVVREVLSADYMVQAATDGEKALKIVEQQKPDLILLDILMPGLDGYEVCRRIKADPSTKNIPIIFLTVKDQEADEARGLSLGAVDYIIKPISAPILRERVKTHLALQTALHTLETQNEELKKAAQLREDVDNIMRHDLKGPLTVIIGYPDLIMRRGSLSEEQINDLTSIQEAGYTMLSMVNMSLDLLKMEQGQYKLDARPVNLVRIFEKIIKDLGTLIREQRQEITLLLGDRPAGDEDAFMVMGEELLAFSLFSNLVRNAIEASPVRGEITIRLEKDDEIGRVLLCNRGVVPKEIRERFFEKYVTAGKKWGTGLGTYTARLMAETLQGRIRLDVSDPGGTTIAVELPSPRPAAAHGSASARGPEGG